LDVLAAGAGTVSERTDAPTSEKRVMAFICGSPIRALSSSYARHVQAFRVS
jgi:hypothetical protein